MDKQKTIQKDVSVSGVGLHTGSKVKLTLKPGEPDSGIVFIRADLAGRPAIKASGEFVLSVSRSPRRTSLGRDGEELHTVEHLMATLSGLGIDNLVVEVEGNEIPGLDGSGLNFMEIIATAGVKEQDKERRYFQLKEPVFIEESGASIAAFPAADFKLSYTLNYNHAYLKTQFMELAITPETFKKELVSARTFCLEEEATELQHQGFGRGANYENTLVVGKSGVIKNTLRFPDEFVRHKMLDLMGDLYVFGQPLKCHIIALCSGHSLNLKLLKKILEQKQRSSSAIQASSDLPVGKGELDVRDIMKILPHRDPFLFVDRIIHLEEGKRAVGIKNVTINDYFFKGHFPGRPVMPGVLIIEALAQVGGVMMLAPAQNRGKLAFFMAINNVKFRKPVVPGDQLVLEVDVVRVKSKTGQVTGRALVDGKVVAEADLMFALADN